MEGGESWGVAASLFCFRRCELVLGSFCFTLGGMIIDDEPLTDMIVSAAPLEAPWRLSGRQSRRVLILAAGRLPAPEARKSRCRSSFRRIAITPVEVVRHDRDPYPRRSCPGRHHKNLGACLNAWRGRFDGWRCRREGPALGLSLREGWPLGMTGPSPSYRSRGWQSIRTEPARATDFPHRAPGIEPFLEPLALGLERRVAVLLRLCHPWVRRSRGPAGDAEWFGVSRRLKHPAPRLRTGAKVTASARGNPVAADVRGVGGGDRNGGWSVPRDGVSPRAFNTPHLLASASDRIPKGLARSGQVGRQS